MLKRVTIDNYALIDSLEINFSQGLNIITGETGAGKSLLLGALSIVLGGKADAGVLRDSARSCVVEAEFDIAGLGLERAFEELDIDYSDVSTIRRVINSAGKSRAFINELPVNVSSLKEFGAQLIDIHSQHQTLLLGSNKFQIELLDSVAKNSAILESYTSDFDQYRTSTRELNDLRSEQSDNRKDEDYLKFQHTQLVDAKLKEGEQENLEQQLNELIHAAEIKEAMLLSDTALTDDETGVILKLKGVEAALRKISAVFPKSTELCERTTAVTLEIKDIATELAIEGERVEIDPEKIAATQQRLDTIYTLQQKHKVSSVDELIAIREEIGQKLEAMENFDARIEELEKKIEKYKKSAEKLAEKISASRRKAAPIVEKQVITNTSLLGMPNVRFVAEITPLDELQSSGSDRVRFLFSANKNIAPQPVEQIASGGEMSRLMLSLKSLVAQHQQLPTIIFDEIDTGISGEIADKMGEIINALSAHLQVINITHLPQVASKGENHYFVYKEDSKTATNTRIRKLTHDERVTEIAKMLSGSQITEAAIEQAKTLINNG